MDLFILLIILFLPIVANLAVNSAYKKYSYVKNTRGMTGKDVARKILDYNGLEDVKIVKISGNLTDNYNPRTKVVSLSSDIYDGSSISSLSVAAHEVGHAIQDKENYTSLVIRSKLVPVVNFTSHLATIFLVIGLASELLNIYYVGIFMLLVGLLFQFVTLPVEFNASFRAKEQLLNLGIVSGDEISGTNSVLRAAAFTYVASFLVMLLQIFRLIYNSRD